MGQKKIKIKYQNKIVDATPTSVNSSSEHWNEYLLEDGTVIKMKLVVTDVVRVDDEFDGEGNPVYVVKSTNVVSVSAPEELKRKD